jgi:enoyl-CoA hydratase/carnithine racemase
VTARLCIVRSELDVRSFERIDRDATVILISPESLAMTSHAVAERITMRRSMVVAAAAGAIGGSPLELALAADWFAAEEDSVLDFSALTGAMAAGVLGRCGSAARPLLLGSRVVIRSEEALRRGVCDSLVPRGEDSVKWLQAWLGTRSLTALASAAALIRRRGGDAAERAEFARLFAESTPQRGLARFLAKKPLDFSDRLIVETI